MPEAVPDALVAAWDSAVATWDQPAVHDKLLSLVATHQAYAWAAAKYKTREDDPVALRQLERLKKSAEFALFGQRVEKEAKGSAYKGAFTFLLILVLLLVALIVFAILYQGGQDTG